MLHFITNQQVSPQEGACRPALPTPHDWRLSIFRLLRNLCGVMTVLDDSYHPLVASTPAHMSGLESRIQAAGKGPLMVSTLSARLGSHNHRSHNTDYGNAIVAHPDWLLPGQIHHSKSIPITCALEEQHEMLYKAEGSLLALQLQWQQLQLEDQLDCRADRCIFHPERMVQNAQRCRSWQMRVGKRLHQA